MIDLYTDSTPNGWKVSIMLEEIQLEYVTHHIDIFAGDQKSPDFLNLNPNGRIPAIVDRAESNCTVFDSGAILIYLAEKTGLLLPTKVKKRTQVLQWLLFQASGIGPMMGQANVFYRYFPRKIPDVIERYHNECRRLFTVLDKQLNGREFICDEYSIADIANWCWLRIYFWGGTKVEGLTHLERWMELMENRAACQKGIGVPYEQEFTKLEKDLAQDNSAVRKIVTK